MKQQKNTSAPRFWGGFALALLLLAAALPALGLLLPPQYGETFLGEMKYKLERLRSTPGKRIVVVGGSGVPFALKSELIAASFPGYEVVDFGMYAHMGTAVMLDWAAAGVHEGDLFILMPEQAPQALSPRCAGEDVWQCADGAWELLTAVSPKRQGAVWAALPAFAGKKLGYALTGAPRPEGVYSRAAFNEYGDIHCPGRDHNILPGGYDPNAPVSFDRSVMDPAFADELNDFARTVTERGGRVFYHFSPMNTAALEPGALAQLDGYYDYLDSLLLFPVLGDPRRCVMDSGWFYDTNFHLNDSGATVFTKLFIEDLKVCLRDTSPTRIPLPQLPAGPQEVFAGDDSDAGCFTYRRGEDGWQISGLTGAGRAAQVLILPTRWQGEPVTDVDPEVFRGDTALRQLTVQPNLRLLYDGMFRGCTALRRLVLTGADPSGYAVGDGLRDGADFLICVPAASLDRYRTGYAWQKYAPWLTAGDN